MYVYEARSISSFLIVSQLCFSMAQGLVVKLWENIFKLWKLYLRKFLIVIKIIKFLVGPHKDIACSCSGFQEKRGGSV